MIGQQIKMQMSAGSKNDSCHFSNGRLSIQMAFFGGLTTQAKQVTCTSVMSFKLQGNNVLFYGYIRDMAPGQTKLSIFNAPRVCMRMDVSVDEGVRQKRERD